VLVILAVAAWLGQAWLPLPTVAKPALINEVDELINQLARQTTEQK
jgi:hypothetical protein